MNDDREAIMADGDGGERINIDPAEYIRTLEEQIREFSVETVRLKSVIETLAGRLLALEAEYQTDENGELVDV